MASIRGKDTRPELLLWELVDHRSLRRYPKIIGNPDMGNKRMKVAVFVDGCFWHGCPLCYKAPSTRTGYWRSKLESNKRRDKRVNETLETMGYAVLRFWEHEVLRDPFTCAHKVSEALEKCPS